jgi:ribosomal protein S1
MRLLGRDSMESTGQDERGQQPDQPQQEQQQATPEEKQSQVYEATFRALSTGDIVPGTVVHVDDEGALVDVGTKSEGIIPTHELGAPSEKGEHPVAVGDRIDVYVVRPEGVAGQTILSKKRADYERVWNRVTQAHEDGEVLGAMVTERVKGGLVVDLGLRGFLPASHVVTRNVYALDRFVGQTVRIKVLEVDKTRKRVVVSQRLAVEEERSKRRQNTIESLEEGQVRKGIVRRITDYGAFVDLGGVDGLLHVTEMDWIRVKHPSEVLKPGQRIDVMVLKFDREQQKVSLGRKQILPDPWQHVQDRYKVGDVVEATVTRVVPFGAFVMLEGGIEGIIPSAELSHERGGRPQDVVALDDKVRVKILTIRPGERRMTLSRRHAEFEAEKKEYETYAERQDQMGRITLGDLVGDRLRGAPAAQPQAAPEEEQQEPEGEECSSSDSPAESPAEKAPSPDSSE